MGRRAKKQKVVTKKRPTLSKRFKCPFCSNEQVVECKMDFKAGVGSLECRLCGASYQMPIHHLHEPVDVFSEWLDDCDAAHQGRNPDNANNTMIPQDEEEDDDDDDDLGMASGLGRAPEAIEDNRKEPARPSPPEQQPQSYSALGLDDSDDDDSD